jgi:hypothetical protein
MLEEGTLILSAATSVGAAIAAVAAWRSAGAAERSAGATQIIAEAEQAQATVIREQWENEKSLAQSALVYPTGLEVGNRWHLRLTNLGRGGAHNVRVEVGDGVGGEPPILVATPSPLPIEFLPPGQHSVPIDLRHPWGTARQFQVTVSWDDGAVGLTQLGPLTVKIGAP